ncbi:MAG: DoxX-like family protein [Chitinophagales bacterium]|nr:DoxX-like family protein [Chitinophagales bacterium]
MAKKGSLNWLHYFIAAVWIANGLICKLMNLEPRHKEIVARILGREYALVLTSLIGIAEIVMALWILSSYKKRLNVLTQIIVIAVMNIIEFFVAPDLLLWGRFNIVFAALFIALIYFNEFKIPKNSNRGLPC